MLKNFSKLNTGEFNPMTFRNECAFRRVANMELFHSFELTGALNSVSIDSSGTYLLGGEEDGRVVLYDLARIHKSVNCDGSIQLFKSYPNKPCPSPLDVKWFPNNPGMFSTLSTGKLKFYDANSDNDDPIDCVDTTAHSKYGYSEFRIHKHHPWNSSLVVGCTGSELRMYDLKVGAFVQTLTLPDNNKHFTHFALSRRSPCTLAAGIRVNQTTGESNIYEYDARNLSQMVLSYLPDPSTIAQSSRSAKSRRTDPKIAHSRSVSYLEYSNDGQYLFSHSTDGVIKKWRTDTGKSLCECHVPGKILHNPNVCSMAITETNPIVAVVPRKNMMYLIDVDSNLALRQLKGHVSQITDVKYDPVFNRIYSVAKERMLLVWETKGSALHDRDALTEGRIRKTIVPAEQLFDSDSGGYWEGEGEVYDD